MALLYDTMKLMVGDEELKCIDEHIDQTKVRLKVGSSLSALNDIVIAKEGYTGYRRLMPCLIVFFKRLLVLLI